MSRRLLAFLLLALGAALLLPAVVAFGHAAYDHSTPAPNEVVATAPAQVNVFFKEDVKGVTGTYFVHVQNDQGSQVSTGDGKLDDNNRRHISADLQAGLPNGRYIVKWKTVSDVDGDEAVGAFCFFVGTSPSAQQTAECTAMEATPTEAATAATTGTPLTAAATAATTPSASPTAIASAATSSSSHKGLIIGVIIGVIVVVVVVGGGAALYMRQSQS